MPASGRQIAAFFLAHAAAGAAVRAWLTGPASCPPPPAAIWKAGGWTRSSASSPTCSGIARGKAMPASKFAKQTHFYLPNSIFLQTITGDWAEDTESGYTEPDMVLTPDYSTASAAPWTADITLQVIHDIHDQDGVPVAMAPRNVLKRVVGFYNAIGLDPIVAPEMEFFLVARNIDPNQPIEPPMGRSGRRAAARQAYSMTRGRRIRPGHRRHLRLRRSPGLRDRRHPAGRRRRPDRDEPAPWRPGAAGRRDLLLQAPDPRGGDAPRLLRHLHGQADPGRARQRDAHPPFGGRHATGRNIFTDETGAETERFGHFIARDAAPPALGDRGAGALREFATAATSATSPRRSTSNGAATTAPPACACRSRAPRRGGSRTGCRGWT